MTPVENTQLLLAKLIRILVDDELAVRVDADTHGTETVLNLHVASKDIGKIIGSHGRMASALRVVVRAIGNAQSIRYSLDIVE